MFDANFIAKPYRAYSYLRAAAPVLWFDKFRNGAWLVSRYADVLAGLHDARLSSQRSHTLTAALPREAQSEFATFNEIFSRWMLFLDPPEHSRIRKLLNKEFTPHMIQRMRPRIERVVNSLLDEVVGKSEMELMTEFANPLPVRVIAEMLGIPSKDQRDFQIWSDALTDFFGNTASSDQEIRKGQTVILLLGSANRDPEKFSEPEKLDIARDEGMPLSFGHGTHFCIGAALAYTEAEIAFETLLERASGLRMLDDVPAWRSNMSFRGLSRLPLALSVR